MNIKDLDLNLLRLFDAIYRLRSVSRAAESLRLSQPAASQGLTRLRLAVGDALFVRAPGGMRPTPRADRLAGVVGVALSAVEEALNENVSFDPSVTQMTLRVHMSDIGEARLLPTLMAELNRIAPNITVQTFPVPHDQIVQGLDAGTIAFAFGYLPTIVDTQRVALLHDRYAVVVRAGHPMNRVLRRAGPQRAIELLQQIDYVAVRSHAETLRILKQLGLESRLKLTSAHFLALPAIVKQTDLAVIMPYEIARGPAFAQGYTILNADLPQSAFTVSLHWSKRYESDPVHRWLREFVVGIF